MISSYLEQPLRTLEQALEDRTRRRAPGAATVRSADSDITGAGSIELLVRLLTEDTDQDGARRRSPLHRRRAA